MKKHWLLVAGLSLWPAALTAQDEPVIVVQVFTTAASVNLPYDMKLMHTQLIPEFKVMLGKDFDIVADARAGCAGQGLHAECGNHRLARRATPPSACSSGWAPGVRPATFNIESLTAQART